MNTLFKLTCHAIECPYHRSRNDISCGNCQYSSHKILKLEHEKRKEHDDAKRKNNH